MRRGLIQPPPATTPHDRRHVDDDSQAQTSTRELPQLRGGLPLLGHALAFKRDPVAFLRHGQETPGDAFTFTLLGQRVAVMSRSERAPGGFHRQGGAAQLP